MQLWIASGAAVVLLAAIAAYRYLDIETIDLKSAAKALLWPIVGILKLGLMTFAPNAPRWLRLAVWSTLNLEVFATLIYLEPHVATLSMAGAMVAFHVLSFVAVLFMIDEETDVWSGLINPQQAKFRTARLLKHPSLLAVSAIWAALFLPLAVWLWDGLGPFPVFASVTPVPCTYGACDYLSYAAAISYQLPFVEWALRDIAPLPARLSEWPGPYLAPALTFLALMLILGAFKVVAFQKKAISDLVVAFGRAKDDATLAYLGARADRAPELIQETLVANALSHRNAKKRRRCIEAMLKAGPLDFSRIFLQRLHKERNASNKRIGIDRITALVDIRGGEFDPKLAADAIDALNRQMTVRKRRQRPAVLTAMDQLHVAFAGLCKSQGWTPGMNKFRRLFDLAIAGEDGIRPRAFEIAATIGPTDLCQCCVEHLTLQNLADARMLPVLTGSLTGIENLVATHGAEWPIQSRTDLAKTITRRRMALVRDSQRLTHRRFGRSVAGIPPEDFGHVIQTLTGTVDTLDRIKAALMKALSELPASGLHLPAGAAGVEAA